VGVTLARSHGKFTISNPAARILYNICMIWAPSAYYSIHPGHARAPYLMSFERYVHHLHAHTRSYGVTFARSHGKFTISNPAARILYNICRIWAPLAYYSIHPGQARAPYLMSFERYVHHLHAHTRSYGVTFARLHEKLNISNPGNLSYTYLGSVNLL